MADDFSYKEVASGLPAETALAVASTVANFIPWIGGAVANVVSGLSVGRKIDRVNEVLNGLVNDLRDFTSEASETYVKTEEFEDLLEATLRQTADERSEVKRQILRSFLAETVKHPGEPYDESKRFLRLINELQPVHMTILRALAQAPLAEEEDGLVGSPIATLRRRLPDLPPERIEELITQMNDSRITALTSLHTMMTRREAADLRHAITPSGERLASFIQR